MSFIAPDEKTDDSMRAFAAKFRARNGNIKAFAPLGYDAANILMAGIAKAGKPDRATIIISLHGADFEYSGVTGKSHFQSDGNNSRRSVYFFTVKDGRFEPIHN
jgi:ABC-type branched-subunit amino acid transport system substrate-binding protein